MSTSAATDSLEPPGPRTETAAALVERLADDLVRRWRQGQQPQVEDYLARHPELAESPAAALELKFLVELPRTLDDLAVLVGALALDRVEHRCLLLGVSEVDAKHLAVTALRAQAGHERRRLVGVMR